VRFDQWRRALRVGHVLLAEVVQAHLSLHSI
jgi:hypothetical protein